MKGHVTLVLSELRIKDDGNLVKVNSTQLKRQVLIKVKTKTETKREKLQSRVDREISLSYINS